MEESKINNESFYQISGWMVNLLKLKGLQLQLYAIIFGFSQDGESEFRGSLQYLCDFTGMSRPSVINTLKELTNNGLLIKRQETVNNVHFNRYKANLSVVKKLNFASKKTLHCEVKEFNSGSKEILHNNIEDNKDIDNKEDIYIGEFDILWKLYPRKIGKPNALKSYIKARKKGISYEEIERGIKAYAEYVKGKDRQYIKHGSTWFNQECWNDELKGEQNAVDNGASRWEGYNLGTIL